jgi:hypothetical protein
MTENQNTAASEAFFCLYPLWRCSCGAIGSGAWAPDIDEVADQLLEVLGIDARVSQPAVPVCGSGVITAQYFDANIATKSLSEIVGQHGYKLQTNTCREHDTSIRCLWICAADVLCNVSPKPSK